MGEAFTNFTNADKAHNKKIHDLNDDINTNRIAHKKAMDRHAAATLAGDKKAADAAWAEAEELDKQRDKIEREIAVLSQKGARTGLLAEAAQAVVDETTATMKELNLEFNNVTGKLDTLRAEFMEHVARAGLIAQEGRRLRAQLTEVANATGVTSPVWLAAPGDNINHDKKKGVIYWDSRLLETTFRKGKVK